VPPNKPPGNDTIVLDDDDDDNISPFIRALRKRKGL